MEGRPATCDRIIGSTRLALCNTGARADTMKPWCFGPGHIAETKSPFSIVGIASYKVARLQVADPLYGGLDPFDNEWRRSWFQGGVRVEMQVAACRDTILRHGQQLERQ